MKKFIILFLFLNLILTVFSGCADENFEDNISQTSETDSVSSIDRDISDSNGYSTKVITDIDTEILKYEETRGDISIILRYPALSETYPVNDTVSVNSDILDWCKYKYDLLHLSAMPEDHMKYEVTDVNITLADKSFISAIVKGQITAEDENHEDVFIYTVNYDLVNKNIVKSTDVLQNIEKFKNTFKTSELKVDFGYDNILSEISLDDIMSGYNDELMIFPDIYFTPERVGSVFSVAFSLGGGSGISVSHESAEKFINNKGLFNRLYN